MANFRSLQCLVYAPVLHFIHFMYCETHIFHPACRRTEVNSIGFTVMDTYDGPFQLEIDYVGVLHEKNHNDTFEYEQYRVEFAEF